MSIRTTLTLLVILAVVGLAAFFLRPKGEVNPWDKPTQTLAGDHSPPLLESLKVNIHRITRLTLAPAGKKALTFERIGDGWQLTSPIVLPLKTAQFEGLILAPLAETQKIGSSDHGDGCGPELGDIEITTDQGATPIRLGRNLGAGIGLIEAGGKVLRVSSQLHDLLTAPPPLTALISAQLDLPPMEAITGLEVQTPRGKARLQRGKNGWTFDAPGAGRASLEAVTAYCAVLGGLKIVEIPQETDDLKRLGFDRPIMQFALIQADGKITRLEIGGPTGPTATHYFIRLTQDQGAPLIATVDTQQIGSLVKGGDFFRDLRVVLMKQEDVRRVRVEQGGKTVLDLSLDKDGKVAFTDKNAPFAVDGELGKASFEAVFGLRGKQAAAIAAPSHQLILTDAFGREEKVSLMASGENYAVQREGDAGGFLVPKAQLAPLLMGAAELRDREIKWLPAGGEIAEITLNTFHFVKTNDTWTTKDGSPFDEPSVVALEKALQHPKVKFYYPADICKEYIANHHLDAKAKTVSGEAHFHLDMNSTGLGNLTLADQSKPLVMMPPEFVSILTGEFQPRQLLALAPNQIASIEINTTKITRRADGTYEASHPKLTQAACAQLFDTLGNLRAEQPISWPDAGTDSAVIVLNAADGKEYTLCIRNDAAAISGPLAPRFFLWPPASPQAKAVQAILDQMKK